MVSNYTLMDEDKLKFLADHGVSLCTSLDGPPEVHDHNRIYLGGNSHAAVSFWIEKILKAGLSTGALMTTTKRSLGYPQEIIDEYARLGLNEVFLRPLHYLGFARRSWGVIGYTDEQFLEFYRRAMEHVLEMNIKHRFFRESTAGLLLRKILLHQDPGYVDLRSPCGATLGQVSYNHDGEIYTCDEGRMMAAEGDKLFKVGHVLKDSYQEIIDHPTTKACCVASTTESQPLCATCTYKPYCGICPVLNQATQNSIWGQMPTNSYCYTFMHIFDYLFEKLDCLESRRVLESWVGAKDSVVAPNCVGGI
jgi:His-Xaa-Ser system radical SAM maturase HxsB